MQSTCPDAAVWQTYLNGSIAAADRASAESHLASCRLCRERLIRVFDTSNEAEVRETVPPALKGRVIQLASARQTAKPFFNFFRPYVPVALAAMIVLAVGLSVLVYRNKTADESRGDFRHSDRVTSELPLTSPPNGATVNSGRLDFRWNDAGAGARYEFVLTDEKGDIIFQGKPTSNSLMLDTSALRLLPQRKYYWSVIARFPDGTRRESGVAGFTLK